MNKKRGAWVSNSDMHPLTNIAVRAWRERDGAASGIYNGPGSIPMHIRPDRIEWFFPEEQTEAKP